MTINEALALYINTECIFYISYILLLKVYSSSNAIKITELSAEFALQRHWIIG